MAHKLLSIEFTTEREGDPVMTSKLAVISQISEGEAAEWEKAYDGIRAVAEKRGWTKEGEVETEQEFTEQSLASSTDDRVTSAHLGNEETDELYPSCYLRWGGGKLQQLWQSRITDRTEWRDVETVEGE